MYSKSLRFSQSALDLITDSKHLSEHAHGHTHAHSHDAAKGKGSGVSVVSPPLKAKGSDEGKQGKGKGSEHGGPLIAGAAATPASSGATSVPSDSRRPRMITDEAVERLAAWAGLLLGHDADNEPERKHARMSEMMRENAKITLMSAISNDWYNLGELDKAMVFAKRAAAAAFDPEFAKLPVWRRCEFCW